MSEIPPSEPNPPVPPSPNQPPSSGPGQPFVGYPRGGAYETPAERSWDISVMATAWDCFTKQIGLWVLSVAIMFIAAGIIQAGLIAIRFTYLPMPAPGASPASIVIPTWFSWVSIGCSFLTSVITQVCMWGMLNLALKQLDHRPVSADDVMNMRGRSGPLWGLAILIGLVSTLLTGGSQFAGANIGLMLEITCGSLVVILPAMVLIIFVGPLIIDKGMGIGEAFRESIKANWPSLGVAILIYIVMTLASAVGLIACCIGILFTYPLFPLSLAATYRRFFPAEWVDEQ